MDPLSLTASVIAVLQISGAVITALYEYRNGVKDASKDAARIIEELISLRNVLESLLRAVEREESTTESSRLPTFQELLRPNGELERCRADLESISEKLDADKKVSAWKSVKRSLVWPFKEKEIEKLLENVQRAKSTLNFALSVDQTVMTLEIHEGVESLTRGFAAIALDRRKSEICEWLGAPDPYPNHAAARKKHQPLTGDWFLGGKHYDDWRSTPKSFLWLYGIPGAGKSVLCSSIIEDLVSECKSKDSCVIAYYYFDFNDIGKRGVESLARAIVVQLLAKISPNSSYVEAVSSQIIDHQSDLDILSQTLCIFALGFETVYIVIDALDECSDLEGLMKWLEKIHGWRSDRIHILTTSRQLPEIEDVIGDCATAAVCLQDSNIGQDIRMLIQQRLKNDRKFQKWPASVRLEIEFALTAKASGMFRWVVCQLDMLRNCVTLPALRKALSSLPKTLDDTYERILVNIDESYVSDVQKVLKFLAFAIRPVGLSEMVEVLAVDWDGDEPRFEPDNRIPEPKDILTMCSTLVATTEDLGTHFSDDGYQDIWQTIRLAHFSVKEYLLSDRIKTSKASVYALDPVSANLFIAKTYLVYLLSPEFSGGRDINNYEGVSRSNWPILRNATLMWPMHIEMVGEGIDDETKRLIRKLFATRHDPNGGSYAAWVAALIPGADSQTIINTPPLYYAASYSMISIVKMLLSETPKSDIDLKGGGAIATPLHVACYRGKPEVVKLLLENGADPNSTNCVGQSCLYWARQKGLLERSGIYDLLMKYGATDKKGEQDSLLMGEMTAKDMLEDEHYTNEYYRLAASGSMDGSN